NPKYASPNFFFTLRFEQIDHFQRIQSRTGNPFNSVLFFDDEDRNIQAVSECDNQKKPEKRFVTLEEIGKRNTSAGNTVDGTQLDAEIAGPENINVTIYSFYILKQYKKVTYPIPTNDSVQFVYLICNMITKCLMLEKEKDGAKGTGKKATIKYVFIIFLKFLFLGLRFECFDRMDSFSFFF
ncbi:hypothetical protein ES319_D12G098300v1, partial [Gossypium barbadense]